MKRIALALVVAAVLFGAVYASAAALNVEGTIQAGVDADLTCDPDGVYVDGWGYENNDMTVRYVRIGGINGACMGKEMVVGLWGSGEIQTKTVAITGVTQRVDFTSPYPLAADILELRVAISD
jgi:hypothetical protein